MEPTPGPVPDPDLALEADVAAMHDHDDDHEDATARREQIPSALWAALGQLGVTGQHLLVLGEDPEVYAGLPAAERRIPHGMTAELTAPVPATRWTHTGLQLRRHRTVAPDLDHGTRLVLTIGEAGRRIANNVLAGISTPLRHDGVPTPSAQNRSVGLDMPHRETRGRISSEQRQPSPRPKLGLRPGYRS